MTHLRTSRAMLRSSILADVEGWKGQCRNGRPAGNSVGQVIADAGGRTLNRQKREKKRQA